jgi:hypothetical protein
MQRVHNRVTGISATNRSRVTNGTQLLVGVDGRSPNGRRFRDLVRAYEAEFGSATEVDRNLIRQAEAPAASREVTACLQLCSDGVPLYHRAKTTGIQR